MRIRDVWANLAGGALPVVRRPEREVHIFDGATYAIAVGWLRRGFRVEYHTPNLPRRVRRVRAAESARLAEQVRQALTKPRPGDIIGGNATGIHRDVLTFRDSNGDVWHRAFGDERYAPIDGEPGAPPDYSTEYDWLTVGGWSTTEGRLDFVPLTVLSVTQDRSSHGPA